MGLSITAYRHIELVQAMTVDEYNASEEWQSKIDASWEQPRALILLHQHDRYAAQSDRLEQGVYRATRGYDFCAGSYGSYNQWRNDLAIFAGYPSAEHVWSIDAVGPFSELIYFSDCEGFIGPATSAKLARDFRHNLERAQANDIDDGYWTDRYREWLRAFTEAAGDGVVRFG